MRPGFRWVIGLSLFAGYIALTYPHYVPALPDPIELNLRLPSAQPSHGEPLIVDGNAGAANFLYLRWLSPTTVVVGYDCWGAPVATSSPVQLTPSEPLRLRISLPVFAQASSLGYFGPDRRLRVWANGADILDAKVEHRTALGGELWVGANPWGGSSCGPHFTGEIEWNGHARHGRLAGVFSASERASLYFRQTWPRLLLVLFGATCLTIYSRPLVRLIRRMRVAANDHRWFVAAGLMSAICFGGLLTGGTYRLIFPDEFGDFFDYQAASLLHGQLDVPREGIGNEAFIVDGKSYGYFGFTPALPRIPFVVLNLGFGQLTRLLMVADFLGCLLAAYLLLRTITRISRPDAPEPSPVATVLLTLNTGVGCSLIFLAGRAYIHNEAIVCGVSFALFAAWCALEHLFRPRGRWWIGALICGLFAVHARPPAGLFALCLLGTVAAWHAGVSLRLRAWTAKGTTASVSRGAHFWPSIGIGVLSLLAVLSFNGVSYLKFHTFDGAPLRYNVGFDAKRLAHIQGQNFHLSNLGYNLRTYLVGPGFSFERHFPWVSPAQSVPQSDYPAAMIDYAEGVAALPVTMTVLFLFATAGCVVGSIRSVPHRLAAAIVWISGIPMIAAMLLAVASAERYAADFCPVFISAAAIGLSAIDDVAARIRRALWLLSAGITLWSAFIMFGLTWQFQLRVVWGVPPEIRARYDRIAASVDHFLGVK